MAHTFAIQFEGLSKSFHAVPYQVPGLPQPRFTPLPPKTSCLHIPKNQLLVNFPGSARRNVIELDEARQWGIGWDSGTVYARAHSRADNSLYCLRFLFHS